MSERSAVDIAVWKIAVEEAAKVERASRFRDSVLDARLNALEGQEWRDFPVKPLRRFTPRSTPYRDDGCETADTCEDASTGKPGKSQETDHDFPETLDFRARENGATCGNDLTLPAAQVDGLSAECPPTGDEPHTECMEDVEETGAERLCAEVEK